MIRYLTRDQVLELFQRMMLRSGGMAGLRDSHGLDSAIGQPQMTFGGQELYPSLVDKAASLAYSLILNHPFMDGNKRIGHAAMEVMLVMNGLEMIAPVDVQERMILKTANGDVGRDGFIAWVQQWTAPFGTPIAEIPEESMPDLEPESVPALELPAESPEGKEPP